MVSKDVNLSKRMEAVVKMVSPQSFAIADVGCDHAYVSIALVKRKLADKVIAMDVRKGPLDIAKRNVELAGLTKRIDIRLGDGLEKLQPGEVDTIIIAGMGGLLIKAILERGEHILSYEDRRPTLILQPQSDWKEVRMFLEQCAYDIVSEHMLIEDGKYYTVMKAKPSGNGSWDYKEEEYLYGRCNLAEQSKALYEFLQRERSSLTEISEHVRLSLENAQASGKEVACSTRGRLDSVRHELEMNARAMQYYIDKE